MDGPTRLCRVEDIEADTPMRSDPEGFPPLVIYRVDDELFVTSNLCTHGNALLSEGIQEGETIECPFHSGTFNVRTGEATGFPCRTALKTYPVVIADGWVCIAV